MGSMEDNFWHRGPLGDSVENFDGINETADGRKGYARALANWNRTTNLLLSRSDDLRFRNTLTQSQHHSFQLLNEWWVGKIQEKFLSEAVQHALNVAASARTADHDHLDFDEARARLSESRYHKEMFLLFQLEFVYETRLLHINEPGTFVGFVQAQRERCAQYAALQRVASSFIGRDINPQGECGHEEQHTSMELDTCLASKLKSPVIPACIESCPWLQIRGDRERFPYYLWDVVEKRTIETHSLECCPEYTCVSHTWGRWCKENEPAVSIPGVPWLVPQNTKFVVEDLPEMLLTAFRIGYVWFDLLCIPQDRSERALIEISRQAAIFGNAYSVIAWLNDALCWDGLRTVSKWLSFFYLKTSVAVEGGRYNVFELDEDDEVFLDDAIELYIWDTEDFPDKSFGSQEIENIGAPVPWFSSLWTLQEICLRPDMILCNRSWEPLTAGPDTLIPLDHLVALDNYLGRGTYRKGLPTNDLVLDGFADYVKATNLSQYADEDSVESSKPNELPGYKDLSALLTDTWMSELNWISPAAIFTFGQLRKCKKSRAEAIMSAVGATDWYNPYVKKHGNEPREDNLVLGLYPVEFLNEALAKIGPTFFTAIHINLGYIRDTVYLRKGCWILSENRHPVGSMLPFTATPTSMLPPQKYAFGSYSHPSVQSWRIMEDGSLHITRAGILTSEQLPDVGEDMLIVPLPDEDGELTSDSEIDTVSGDLNQWLRSFSNPQEAPNFAVSLYQQIYWSKAVPGPQVGLLLKQVGQIGSQAVLVKVGQFFTKSLSTWDVEATDVDWIVL